MQTEYFRANNFYHAGARFITALLIVLWPFTPAAPRAVTSQITAPKCDATEKPGVCTVDANREVRSLAMGSVSEREIKAGEEHFYRVALSAGEFTQIVVEQQGIDLGVAACAQLQVVSEVDRQSGSWGPEAISLIAKEAGEYLIRVKPLLSTGKGSYKIQVKQQRRSEPLDQVRINAERIVTEGGRFYARGGAPCLRQSIASYEQALSLWQSLGEKEEMAITLYGLGWSYSDLGSQGMVKFPSPRHRLRWNYEAREDHLAALRYFNQALELMRSLNDPYGEAITLAGRAWPDLYLGRTDEALLSFSNASTLFNSLGNVRGDAISTYGLGWAYMLLEENEKALVEFSRALDLRRQAEDRRGEASTLAAISRIHSRLGRDEDALKTGLLALNAYKAVNDERGQASTYATLGWIYNALGRRSEALAAFESSLKLLRPSDATGRANTIYGIARVQKDQGNLAEALAQMKEVVANIDSLRDKGSDSDLRTYYFANVQEYYEFYIDLLMLMHEQDPARGYAATALAASESARAREILAVLTESVHSTTKDFSDAISKPVDLSSIQRLLDEQTVLVEYFLGEQKSYVWLVSPSTMHVYQLPKRADIEPRARRLYTLLTERNRSIAETNAARLTRIERADIEASQVANELGKILLQPVAQHLAGKRIVTVSQSALQLVPIGILPITDPQTKQTAPLLVDHQILNLPSASILPLLRERKHQSTAAKKTIAVLADPVFSKYDSRLGESQPRAVGTTVRSLYQQIPNQDSDTYTEKNVDSEFQRLPGTRWEATQIASLVPKDDVFLALDFSANRATATSEFLSQYRIIHFATHALVDDAHPGRSRIVLSQFDQKGDAIDGSLTLTDIYKLKLGSDLVVLSACQTGLGVETRGEGLVGLTGGFMRAGVSRVLVSLWPLSDRATAEFMTQFYRGLLGPRKLSPPEALRAAQLNAQRSRRWSSPYFWAPFVLNGDWRWSSN
jgi:CHAT domain-containing protein